MTEKSEDDAIPDETPAISDEVPETQTPDENVPFAAVSAESAMVPSIEALPSDLYILPIDNRPIFPGLTMPLQISDEKLLPTLELASESASRTVGIGLSKKYNEEDPNQSDLYEMGTVMRILKYSHMEDSDYMLVQTLRRFRIRKVIKHTPALECKVEYFHDPEDELSAELKAYVMAVISSVKELLKLNPLFQEQLKLLLANLSYDKPGLIMDLVASLLSSDSDKLQEILETIGLIRRAEKLMKLLQEEIQLFTLQEKIKKRIEEKISKQQKEFFLHEQLKEIKKELGLEKDDKSAEIEKFHERLKKLHLNEEAQKVFDEEISKLNLLDPAAPEYNVSRAYLEWLTSIPWGVHSEDNYDINRAKEILDRDHYGLDDIKDRILEFISKGKKTGDISGSILLFVGPPGTGKTSIGRSVAEALNRKFFRFSLGGMRDEAEIKGHRRTYIGAMPGKFIQSLKTVGTANPLIMLDEIDKIGASFRGDPASALLEVLDPEQNRAFLDHYLDIRFDLSNVLFIATANQIDTIPPALLDRMEMMKLSGYIMDEKIHIARKFLIPRVMKEHKLTKEEILITDTGLNFIIERYAREAGVRGLENQIKKIMRRITRLHAEGDTGQKEATPENIPDFIGQPIFPEETLYGQGAPGITLGLAWTSMGGTHLFIEAARVQSKHSGYKQTGQLGNVMQESSEIAYTYLRSNAKKFGIDPVYFQESFIHLHVPAGATPKDGPSAGITMAMTLYSLATGKPVRNDLAMTGEITLTGKVLPVGGIKEKLIAARRIGIKEIILPKDNLTDYKELPEYIRSELKIYFADYFGDVLQATFEHKGKDIIMEP